MNLITAQFSKSIVLIMSLVLMAGCQANKTTAIQLNEATLLDKPFPQ